jgi:hypothetical protein
MRYGFSFLLGLLLPLLAGCGPDTGDRLPVSGNVTLKNAPVASGTINFEAKAGGIFTGGVITDGKYAIAAENGLEPGTYIVRISVAEPGVADTEPLPGESGPPGKELVPPEYNAESKQEVEVKPGVENTFNFDIP